MNAKPSQVHENPELLKIKAAQANARRKERLDQKRADENVRRREEMRAKRAAEDAVTKKEEQLKEEQIKQEEPANRKNTIKIVMNGVEYKTLTDAVITLPGCSNQRGEDGLHSHFTVSMWNKINRQLKKTGEFTMEGYHIKKI